MFFIRENRILVMFIHNGRMKTSSNKHVLLLWIDFLDMIIAIIFLSELLYCMIIFFVFANVLRKKYK